MRFRALCSEWWSRCFFQKSTPGFQKWTFIFVHFWKSSFRFEIFIHHHHSSGGSSFLTEISLFYYKYLETTRLPVSEQRRHAELCGGYIWNLGIVTIMMREIVILNIHICYDKIWILYVGFDSMIGIGIVFYKMWITIYEVTVSVASIVSDE